MSLSTQGFEEALVLQRTTTSQRFRSAGDLWEGLQQPVDKFGADKAVRIGAPMLL